MLSSIPNHKLIHSASRTVIATWTAVVHFKRYTTKQISSSKGAIMTHEMYIDQKEHIDS